MILILCALLIGRCLTSFSYFVYLRILQYYACFVLLFTKFFYTDKNFGARMLDDKPIDLLQNNVA
jgi:hypothetical protein